jgi:hypothetical protein
MMTEIQGHNSSTKQDTIDVLFVSLGCVMLDDIHFVGGETAFEALGGSGTFGKSSAGVANVKLLSAPVFITLLFSPRPWGG